MARLLMLPMALPRAGFFMPMALPRASFFMLPMALPRFPEGHNKVKSSLLL